MAVLSRTRLVSAAAVAAAAGFIVHAMLSGDNTPIGFWLYSLAPYGLAAWFVVAPWGEERAQDISGCIIGFALLVLSYLAWRGAVFRPTSSTAGLIFLFLPIYLVVGGAIAWPLLYVMLKRSKEAERVGKSG
jgi:hypothetical protein